MFLSMGEAHFRSAGMFLCFLPGEERRHWMYILGACAVDLVWFTIR